MERQETTTCQQTKIELTDSQVDLLMDCGALDYGPEMISKLLGLEIKEAIMLLEKSSFKKDYEKGKALANYRIELKLLELATQGDSSAMRELQKIQKERKRKK